MSTRPGPGRTPMRTDWWDGLSNRTQHLVCLLVLLVVSLGFYAPIHFGGLSIVAGDTVSWRAMAQAQIAHEEETGEQALWAPNAFSGMPAYTISYDPPVPQADDIATFLRSFMWPTSHVIFLLVGVYLFIVLLTGSKLGGVLAACAYGLTTYIPILLIAGHNTKFIALCYAPWVVLAFAFALRRPGLLSGLLFAAALALNLRAGHIQITYYLAFLLGIWWLVECVGAVRHGRLKGFATTTGWLVLGTILGVLMVAQPYMLLQEYRAYSTRGGAGVEGAAGLDWEYAMNWSQGLGEMVTLLIADAYGGSALYWGAKPFTAGPHYVGGIVVLLAGLALWRVRRNAVWGLGMAALVMIFFALGEHFPLLNRPMYDYFPLFSSFRVPETWLSIVALALGLLAAFGLAYLARPEETVEREVQKTKSAFVAVGVVVGMVLLLFVLRGAFFDFERPGEIEQVRQIVAQQLQQSPESPQVTSIARQAYQEQWVQPREEAFAGDAVRTLIFLLLAGALIFMFRRGVIPPSVMQAGLALLVLIDLWGVGRRYFNEDLLAPSSTLEANIPTYDFDQYLLQQQREAGGAGNFRVLSYEANPMVNARPSYYYESLGGYSAAKLGLYQQFVDNVLFDPETGMPNEQALDLLNTRYVVAPGVLPDTRVVYESQVAAPGAEGPGAANPNQQRIFVLENPDAVPRAFLVGDTEVIGSTEETWARITSPAFDPLETVILPEPIEFEPVAADSAGAGTVTLQSYTPDEIVWQVETNAPRLLVASEIYYPAGWKAFVDEEEAPIHRANYFLRAVPVPEGRHTVTMRFDPPTERLSFWISALSTLLVYGGIVALAGMAFAKRRREQERFEGNGV